MIFNFACGHVLLINQTVTTKPVFYQSVLQALVITQSVHHNQRTRRITQRQKYTQSVQVDRTVINLAVNDFLQFNQVAQPPPIEISITQYLNHHMFIQFPIVKSGTQFLNHTQAVSYTNDRGTRHTQTHTQTVSYVREYDAALTQTLNHHGSAAYFLNRADFIADPVVITPLNLITWTFGSYTFQSRAPIFGNKEILNFSRISRRSRAGDLIIYRDPVWPESIQLNMTFDYLTETLRNYYYQLFLFSLGKGVLFTDQYNRTWAGIILNPGSALVQTGRCNWRVDIQFQGSPV